MWHSIGRPCHFKTSLQLHPIRIVASVAIYIPAPTSRYTLTMGFAQKDTATVTNCSFVTVTAVLALVNTLYRLLVRKLLTSSAQLLECPRPTSARKQVTWDTSAFASEPALAEDELASCSLLMRAFLASSSSVNALAPSEIKKYD